MKSSTKKGLKRRVKQLEKANRKTDDRLRLLEAIISSETAEPPAEGDEPQPDEAPATVPAEGEDELSDDDSEETSE